MSNEKRPTKVEFFTEEPPPEPEKPVVPVAAKPDDGTPAASPTIALGGVQKELVVAQNVPDLDDPGVLLRRLTGKMAAEFKGSMTGEQLAQEAERDRHNAHVGAERMIDLEQRRQRREAQGKPRNKRG